MNNLSKLFLSCALAAISGCTWVAPTPQVTKEDIMVLPQTRIAGCRLISKTQVSVVDRIGFINRAQSDVEKDLQTLALNQAGAQGGDTVSPLTPANNGTQTFGIYKCLGTKPAKATAASAAGTAVKTTPYQPPH